MSRIKEVISLINCMDRMPSSKKGDDWTSTYMSLVNELHFLKKEVNIK